MSYNSGSGVPALCACYEITHVVYLGGRRNPLLTFALPQLIHPKPPRVYSMAHAISTWRSLILQILRKWHMNAR